MTTPDQPAPSIPACELDDPRNPHPPGKIQVKAIAPGNTYLDPRTVIRVCVNCLYPLTQQMRRDQYIGIEVTAPEDTTDYAALRKASRTQPTP